MNKWLRKTFVVLVSLLTFGLITPAQQGLIIRVNADNNALERETTEQNAVLKNHVSAPPSISREKFVEDMVRLAETRSMEKFGAKIKPVIENEFREIILPNIEKAIAETAGLFPEEDLADLSISEQPGSGLSEKIFNIKNSKTGTHVIRFHVRRDNPPQAGYWFNFHYHTAYDNFQEHHDLGSLYWDRNMPPKWMA